jgi:hypothetical protein
MRHAETQHRDSMGGIDVMLHQAGSPTIRRAKRILPSFTRTANRLSLSMRSHQSGSHPRQKRAHTLHNPVACFRYDPYGRTWLSQVRPERQKATAGRRWPARRDGGFLVSCPPGSGRAGRWRRPQFSCKQPKLSAKMESAYRGVLGSSRCAI